jgi:hypothetical protein
LPLYSEGPDQAENATLSMVGWISNGVVKYRKYKTYLMEKERG